jgi:hypothetical protein
MEGNIGLLFKSGGIMCSRDWIGEGVIGVAFKDVIYHMFLFLQSGRLFQLCHSGFHYSPERQLCPPFHSSSNTLVLVPKFCMPAACVAAQFLRLYSSHHPFEVLICVVLHCNLD